jgi:hypothetical protein
MIPNHFEIMEEEQKKHKLKVIIRLAKQFWIYYLDYAAENNQIHGMTIEDFQHGFLNQHNIYRRQMCANDLQNDHTLHDIAQKRAHDKANGKQIDLSDDFGENSYEIDTGDPSKITGKIYLCISS